MCPVNTMQPSNGGWGALGQEVGGCELVAHRREGDCFIPNIFVHYKYQRAAQ